MKKLVTEIKKETLIKYLPLFGIDSQVTIMEDAQATWDTMEVGKSRFT